MSECINKVKGLWPLCLTIFIKKVKGAWPVFDSLNKQTFPLKTKRFSHRSVTQTFSST